MNVGVLLGTAPYRAVCEDSINAAGSAWKRWEILPPCCWPRSSLWILLSREAHGRDEKALHENPYSETAQVPQTTNAVEVERLGDADLGCESS